MSEEKFPKHEGQEQQEAPESPSLPEPGDSSSTEQTVQARGGKQKIEILLKPTGDAPIIKKKRWFVEQEKEIGWIIQFMKKNLLKMDPTESLFLYVNQAFAPSPDQLVKNVHECFGTDGKLVLHYCKGQAWG